MRIALLGAGFIGTIMGALLCRGGQDVVLVDNSTFSAMSTVLGCCWGEILDSYAAMTSTPIFARLPWKIYVWEFAD